MCRHVVVKSQRAWKSASLVHKPRGGSIRAGHAPGFRPGGRLLRPNTYLEPFALRALGVVREAERLVEIARVRFAGLGLAWHASQTAVLLEDG